MGRPLHGTRSPRIPETTRDAYRRNLERYVYPYLDERLRRRLSQVSPRDLANLIAWLCDEREQGKRLSDSTIRNVLNPVRACLATAKAEGLIRHNPAQGLALPHRPVVDDAEAEEVRPLTREQLAAFLELVHQRHQTFFRLLAATGLRMSEAVGLQWRHLALDGSIPHVKVRRALVRGKGGKLVEHPPKSRHGRRDVPLASDLVSELRERRKSSEWGRDDDLVFCSEVGGLLSDGNVRRRHLAPVAEEVGAPWAGFHTFRHTFCVMHIARGTNVMQLARLLGHHSAGFTLEVYGHLMDADRGEPLDLGAELAAVPPLLSKHMLKSLLPSARVLLEIPPSLELELTGKRVEVRIDGLEVAPHAPKLGDRPPRLERVRHGSHAEVQEVTVGQGVARVDSGGYVVRQVAWKSEEVLELASRQLEEALELAPFLVEEEILRKLLEL